MFSKKFIRKEKAYSESYLRNNSIQTDSCNETKEKEWVSLGRVETGQ